MSDGNNNSLPGRLSYCGIVDHEKEYDHQWAGRGSAIVVL